jgi:hypothetical protein
MARYIVMTASAQMPSSCRGVYKRVAVVELNTDYIDKGIRPLMISPTAQGVRRIVETWERCNVGSTERSAYAVAMREAEALAAKLNSEAQS